MKIEKKNWNYLKTKKIIQQNVINIPRYDYFLGEAV